MRATGNRVLLEDKPRILFGVLVAAVLAVFGWQILRPHEPVFHGRPLSFWLDEAYKARCPTFPDQCPQAAEALRAMGPAAVPELLRLLSTADSTGYRIMAEFAREFPFLHLPRYRGRGEMAIWGFKILGPQADSGIAGLLLLLNEKDASVRINAARALGALGPTASAAVPDLISVIKRSTGIAWQDKGLREAAAASLGEIGPAAAPAIPALESLTNELSGELALIKIRGKPFVPFFERLKDTSDPGQWLAAARLVGTLGADAEPAIPFLLSGLICTNRNPGQPHTTIQETALLTLGLIHRRPDVCVPAIAVLLQATEPNVRYQALVALTGFGKAATPAVPDITRCITNSPQWLWVQHEGFNLLKSLDPKAAAQIRLPPLQ